MMTNSHNNDHDVAETEFTLLQEELVQGAAPPTSSSSMEYANTGLTVRVLMRLTNLDFIYVFDKAIKEDSVVRLKESLSDTLSHYRTLAGRMEGVRIQLNNHGAAFRVQEAFGGSIHDIPEEPPTGPAYCHIPIPNEQTQGTAPLLTVTITKFADGWALGLVINHLIADAWTIAMFMKDWSILFNHGSIEPVIYQLPSVVTETYPTQAELDQAAEEVLGMKRSPLGKRLLLKALFRWILPMMMKSKDPRLGRTPDRMIIRYTQKQVQEIKVNAETRAGTWVSTNEALLSHVWQVFMDAAKLNTQQRSCVGASVVVNLRGKLDSISSRVIGNVGSVTEIVLDMNQNENKNNDSVEKRLHDTMRAALTVERITAANRMMNALWLEDSDFITYENKTTGDITFGGLKGCIPAVNWQAKFPYYEVDFGSGRPIRGIPWDWNQPVTFLPAAGKEGGIEVYIDLTSRGPVSWMPAQPKSKSLMIRNVLGIAAVSGSLVLSSMGAGRSTALLWLASMGILSVVAAASASSSQGKDPEGDPKQEFQKYVAANAHRSLDHQD